MNAGLFAGLPNGTSGAVRKAVALVNGTPNTVANAVVTSAASAASAAAYAVGAVTANVFKPVFTLSGKGQLNFVMVSDPNSPTLTCRITTDGVSVVNKSSAVSVSGFAVLGGLVVGASGDPVITQQSILFDQSCVIEVTNSTGAANTILYVNAEVHV